LEGHMELWGIPTWLEYPENGTRCMRSSHHCVQVACRAPRARRLWVTQRRALQPAVSETNDKNRPKPDGGKGNPLHCLSPRDGKKGECLNPRDTEGRDHKGSPIRVCGLTKRCLVLDASKGDQEDEFWPVTSSEWSWGESESVSHQD
jgi:hypothetical protein